MPVSFTFLDKAGEGIPLGKVYTCAANAVRVLDNKPILDDTNEVNDDRKVYSLVEYMCIKLDGKTIEEAKVQYNDKQCLLPILCALEKELGVHSFDACRWA